MATAAAPVLKEGSVAELLDDSYARFGYCKGSLVRLVENPDEGRVKITFGSSGMAAYANEDQLRPLDGKVVVATVPFNTEWASQLDSHARAFPGARVEDSHLRQYQLQLTESHSYELVDPYGWLDDAESFPLQLVQEDDDEEDCDETSSDTKNHGVAEMLQAEVVEQIQEPHREPEPEAANWALYHVPPKEPRFCFLLPQRLICLRLERGEVLGQSAMHLADAVLSLVRMCRSDIERKDTFDSQGCPIMAQLHSLGIWRREYISALAELKCHEGNTLQAVGLASNLKDRGRAMHLSLATALSLELLKGPAGRMAFSMMNLLRSNPVLSALVREAREVKREALGVLPDIPSNEENFDFAMSLFPQRLCYRDPKRWLAIGRIGGEAV